MSATNYGVQTYDVTQNATHLSIVYQVRINDDLKQCEHNNACFFNVLLHLVPQMTACLSSLCSPHPGH